MLLPVLQAVLLLVRQSLKGVAGRDEVGRALQQLWRGRGLRLGEGGEEEEGRGRRGREEKGGKE